MIEKIVIKKFIDGNGVYYKVREKRKLNSDFGIFKDYDNAYKKLKLLTTKKEQQK